MSGLKKDLGLWQGMGLLATSLLGTGIFVVPATAASLAGGASLWAWLLLIALVLPIAFTFARLGRRYPFQTNPTGIDFVKIASAHRRDTDALARSTHNKSICLKHSEYITDRRPADAKVCSHFYFIHAGPRG